MNIKTVKASELTSGMRLKRGLTSEFTCVERVNVGIAYTTYDLTDGTRGDVRNITVMEIAS